MVVGELAESVDFLVVGGGPGGYAAALRAAQLGRDVTLVDRDGERGLGGVCLREGCIPSKALIEVANRADGVRAFGDAGLRVTSAGFDMAVFQEWKEALVGRLAEGVRQLLAQARVRVVTGTLRFTRPTQAVVRTPQDQAVFFEFDDAIIATGSGSVHLPELPRDGDAILDSTDALALTALPGDLVVVGGGYIGLEIGTACAKLGARVSIVEQARELLPALDPRLVRPVRRRLGELGVDVYTGAAVTDFDGRAVVVKAADGEHRVGADKVVVAVGRRPNTDRLGLEHAGIARGDTGLLEVAPDRRVGPRVAAIGDITPGRALAHKATAEAHVAAEALCGRRVAFAPQTVPAVVFSDPEVASAGLSVDAARSQGVDVAATTFALAASGRAATAGTDRGFCQLVVDTGSGTVAGVHIVGPHASDLIAQGVLAIEMAATVEDVALSIHPHPTFSEPLAEAARAALGRPVHVSGRAAG